MSTALRSPIALPKVRFDQLQAIAERRGLPHATALIGAWVARAIEEGELPAGTPGYSAQVVGGKLLIEIAGNVLPAMPAKTARMFAAILSAAAGTTDPALPFQMPVGRPVPLEWEGNSIAIARAGHRGVRFLVRPEGHEGESIKITSATMFITELADALRQTLDAR